MADYSRPYKRRRSQSPSSGRDRAADSHYRSRDAPRSRDAGPAPSQRWSHKDQMRINQLQEDERMREWVAQEDDFVLKQAKLKAVVRVREGRAKPIDWLAVTLRVIDSTRNAADDDADGHEIEFMDPDSVFDGLSETQLADLRKDIDTYVNLETNPRNRDYWRTMQIICQDRQRKSRPAGPEGRAVSSVAADIDRLLRPKTHEQLEQLERQIRNKLASNEPIDTDYWQQLLDSLLVWKAKAKLKRVYQDVLDSRLQQLRSENQQKALVARQQWDSARDASVPNVREPESNPAWDPDPWLQIPSQDKGLEVVDESAFLDRVAAARRRIVHMGYVPAAKPGPSKPTHPTYSATHSNSTDAVGRFDRSGGPDDHSSATHALFDREVAKGINDDEEVFAGEEEVEPRHSSSQPLWSGKYRPRKPKYFNRVQMGYEWNKYNQTHYDHDNPPPKVVQGYKFHIFYPDLIDPAQAPTYKISREGGRKKGQTMAPAGEEDTCIIRFMSGPPYEDIAFRIVDRDWDYSAKHDRGFKSTFERGILTLHFSFKRIVYRK